MLECVRRSCGAAGDVEFVEDIADMSCNRLLTEAELVGDHAVRASGGNETKHLQLTAGKTSSCAWRHPQRVHTRNV
jgi:hypothetical protein